MGADVLLEIAVERAAQDRKWGGPAHDDSHSEADWMTYIHGKVMAVPACYRHRGELRGVVPWPWDADAEKSIAWLHPTTPQNYRRRLVQIAALAVTAIESFDRKRGDAVQPTGGHGVASSEENVFYTPGGDPPPGWPKGGE